MKLWSFNTLTVLHCCSIIQLYVHVQANYANFNIFVSPTTKDKVLAFTPRVPTIAQFRHLRYCVGHILKSIYGERVCGIINRTLSLWSRAGLNSIGSSDKLKILSPRQPVGKSRDGTKLLALGIWGHGKTSDASLELPWI